MIRFPAINTFLFAARGALVSVTLVLLAAGCTYEKGDPVPVDVSGETITYAKVISPLFDLHCRQCHGSSVAATLGGSYDLGTYQAIKKYSASSLLGSIEHTPGFLPMPKGRAKIPDADIQRIKAWFAAGAPDN